MPSNQIALGHNHRRILEILRLNGPLPRIEVADIADLQPATLTRLSQELIDWGLLEDLAPEAVADTRSAAKRKTRLLRVDGSKLHTAGIAISLDRIICALVSLSGQVTAETVIRADVQDPVSVSKQTARALEVLMTQSGVAQEQVLAAGLSLPINFGSDPVRQHVPAEWPLWRNGDAREIFEQHLSLVTFVENDAHAAALAEAYFGIGATMDSFTLIYVGYGIGGGNIVNRRLFRGSFGNAAAFGALFPQEGDRPSGKDLIRQLAQAGRGVRTLFDLDGSMIADPVVQAWLDRAAEQIVPIVRHAQVLLNGDAVVLGGLLPAALNEALVARLNQLSSSVLSATQILTSTIAPGRFHLGAASIPQYELTAPHKFRGRAVKGY